MYYEACKKNLTDADVKAGALTNTTGGSLKRCAQPLLTQQWGLKLNASEIVGLEKAIHDETSKSLAGIGVYTLDGILATDRSKPKDEFSAGCRKWYSEIVALNQHYKIPVTGTWKVNCAVPGPHSNDTCTGCFLGSHGDCKNKLDNTCFEKIATTGGGLACPKCTE